MKKLYVVGIGPGGLEHMTKKAVNAIVESEVIVAYKPYLEYVKELIDGKETMSNGMYGEVERCQKAIEYAESGRTTSVISTGDAGVYGMAGLILELVEGKEVDVEIIPGVSSAMSAAAELGAPLMHDFAVISLSDKLTDLDLIMKRVKLAAEGDFVIAIYNPRSKGRPAYFKQAIEIISEYREAKTPVGIVKDSGREGTKISLTTIDSVDYESVDMLTIVIVGNSSSYIRDGKMITPRGYLN